ncbi:hypothetical protein VTN00DRAFT_7483 [Thermoascus crustaceus]|uniref:uncharacterized protein n=1 Tax=Thermoascus crustaceus TaxID=5088 RepID=UPI00374413FC
MDQKRQSRRLSFTLQVQRILSLDKQGDAKQVIDTSTSLTRGTSIDVQSAPVSGSRAGKPDKVEPVKSMADSSPGINTSSGIPGFSRGTLPALKTSQALPGVTDTSQTSMQSVTHDETWNTASQNARTSTETNKTDRPDKSFSSGKHHYQNFDIDGSYARLFANEFDASGSERQS